MRLLCVVFACWVHLGSLLLSAQSAEKPAQPCPFHPRSARIWDKHAGNFVWRDVCGNTMADHPLGGGFEWEGDSRCYLALGEAQVRGKRRGGLVMLAFPDENVLRAQWKVDIAKGRSLAIQYALTDEAARLSSNGLKFSVLATDDEGQEHTLIDDTLKRGDTAVRDRRLRFDFHVRKITFVHDNLGKEVWDVLWINPEGLVVPEILPPAVVKRPSNPAPADPATTAGLPSQRQIAALRLAVEDLIRTFADRYPKGREFLERLDRIEKQVAEGKPQRPTELADQFDSLRREALTANPLVSGQPILFVVRRQYRSHYHAIDTLFHTGEFNPDRGIMHSDLFQGGGAIKTIEFARGGEVKTLLEVPQGIARDPDVYFDASRIVFALRRRVEEDYHLWEMNVDGTGLRQLTSAAGVADFDPIYLPDDGIVFSSTREPKYNMCSRDIAANLFRMEGDGANIHQITKNTLFENHSELLPDGRILYARWEYVDRNFGDAHGLWTVNPDGTNQAVYWGNNTAVPGAVFNAHPIPGTPRFVCILGPHHDRLWGAMGIIDRRLGVDGRRPVLQTWPADAIDAVRAGGRFDCDSYTRTVRLKYEDCWPLGDKYFLCSRMIGEGETTGIYLIDVFGNEILLHTEGPGCYDPMPVKTRPRPPVIPSRRNFENREGFFFVADVYQGTHMQGVKPATVKMLRVVESPEKRHWAKGSWGGQGYTAPGMNWHSLENKRILGTVPVEEDGSAYFAVPADTFVYFQLLDREGMMVQSMRSGTVVQSGERTGCVGCHDRRRTAPPRLDRETPLALKRPPSRLEDWYGPPRLFGFTAEVQPVLTKHCVSCHDYGQDAGRKLNLAGDRTIGFNTAYHELWRKGHIRCIGGGPAEVQAAYSWGSHASRLVEVIRHPKIPEHQDLRLSSEDFARIVTWLDLNAVYYPTYACAYPESLTGRCPLDNRQLERLSQLTGMPIGPLRAHNSNRGPQVSFDRPELSPCLAKFNDKSDPQYREALSIIEAGRQMLAKRPRADMPGFERCAADRNREQKYARRRQVEARSREAIRTGKKIYDRTPFAGGRHHPPETPAKVQP